MVKEVEAEVQATEKLLSEIAEKATQWLITQTTELCYVNKLMKHEKIVKTWHGLRSQNVGSVGSKFCYAKIS